MGGGCFADQVRQAQKRWQFDDETGHKMALLGMRQYGHLLAALSSFPITEQVEIPSEKPAVWLAADDVFEREAWILPTNWTVTSDSIAAWLAQTLQAQQLILIKSVSLAQSSIDKLCDDYFMQVVKDLDYTILSAEEWLDFSLTKVINAKITDLRRVR